MLQPSLATSPAIADEVLSSLTSATSLSNVPTTPGTIIAEVQAIDGRVGFRVNSQTPTASASGEIYAGNWHSFTGRLDEVSFIEIDSGAKAYVVYKKG